MEKRYIIVGIDPGTTVGIAVLALDGSLIALRSSKDLSIDGIVETIVEYGVPALIATDVETLPQTVEKVSASFEARLFIPSESISLKEKNEGARDYPVRNAHERDALAAARKAHAHYRQKFANIDARLAAAGRRESADEVKALVLRDLSVSEALAAIDRREPGAPVQAPERHGMPAPTGAPQPSEVRLLLARIRNQHAYIAELEQRISAANRRMASLEGEIRRRNEAAVARARETAAVRERDARIARLEQDRRTLRKDKRRLVHALKTRERTRALDVGDVLVCKVLPRFARADIEALATSAGLAKGDVLYMENSSGGGAATAQLLADRGVRAIIVRTEMSHAAREQLDEAGVAALDAGRFAIRVEGGVAVTDRARFEEAYAAWAAEAARRANQRRRAWLEGLIDTYRYERTKGHDQ